MEKVSEALTGTPGLERLEAAGSCSAKSVIAVPKLSLRGKTRSFQPPEASCTWNRKTSASRINVKHAIHSKFPMTMPSLAPPAASPTRWIVEMFDVKTAAPTVNQPSDLLARKYWSVDASRR